MAVSIAALAIGAGIAIYGAVKKNQAKKKAAANVRPEYDIPQEEYDSQNLAETQANRGMSAESHQYFQNQNDQGLAATSEAILRGGGDANAIGSAYGNYVKGVNSLSVYDDQQRQAHLANLQNSYLRMSANKDKQWQINTYGKWADNAQALAAEQAGASQTMNSGLNIAGQGLTGVLGAQNMKVKPTPTPDSNTGQYDPSALQSVNGNSNFTNNFGGMSTGGGDGGLGYSGGWGWNGITPARE